MKHSLLAMLIALLCTCTLHAQNREADSLALVDLYCHTNGLFWTNTWGLNTLDSLPPIYTWFGVDTSHVNGEVRVTCLDLDDTDDCSTSYWGGGNNLSGILPDLNLTELRYLYLSHNHLTGTVPNFTHLNKLEELYLDDNHFTAVVPNTGLESLRVLSLERNYLTLVPDFEALPVLEALDLDDNHITTIPAAINMGSLLLLSLANNHLFGTIPNVTGLPVLEELNLGGNHLSGALPNLEHLPNLKKLWINNNYLSGEVTDLILPNLNELYLHHNHLTSVFDFTSLSNLQILDLDYNSLNTVPDFGGLPNLLNLHLSHNMMSDVPLFGGLSSLQRLYLNDNCLTGIVPDFETPNLVTLHLHNNYFTELINFTNLNSLYELDLSNSNLTGGIPDFTGLDGVYVINLSGNCLSGNIPNFTEINPATLDLSNNCLTGTIPDFSNTVPDPTDMCSSSNLKKIYLNNNNLTGQIPTFEQFYRLEQLDFSHNELTGPIPSFQGTIPYENDGMGDCVAVPPSRLQVIRFNDNNLEGNISNVANLDRLSELNLSNNNDLDETISHVVGLVELRYLDLSNNNFSGIIPPLIGALDTLFYLNLSHNNLGGNIPVSIGSLIELRELNFSHNSLTEDIPPTIGNLDTLFYLNLSHNSLYGTIPSTIGNLIELRELNLSHNKNDTNNGLTGSGTQLDTHLDGLYKLSILNLSHNSFSGTLPTMSGTVDTLTDPDNPSSNITKLYLHDNNFSGEFPVAFINLDDGYFSDLTLYNNPQLSGCYDTLLYVLCNNNFDSDQISDGTDFDTTWEVFCEYYDEVDSIEQVCDCAYRDRKELMRLHSVMQGGIWTDDTNWGDAAEWGDWYGITIDDITGCVTGINLNDNNLTGIIPNDLLLLNLENLDLSENSGIEGGIPQWIAELDSLETIDLSHCSLSGCYPDYLEPLCSVTTSNADISEENDFDIPWSSFCVGEPCSEPQSACSADQAELIAFYTATNGEDWIIGWDINASSMEDWHGVEINDSGCVTEINLHDNGLEGTIPPNMNLPHLTTLNLSRNQLIGALPDFSDMPNITSLNLSENHLTGIININLPDLEYLNLSSNALTTALIMSDFSGSPLLKSIDIHNNYLNGLIPNFNLPELESLNLSDNNLEGQIPNFNLPKLGSLNLRHNNLGGNIPNFDSLPELDNLYLNYNNLEGNIPNFDSLLDLDNLYLYENNLSGNIPNFNLPELDRLELNHNNLSGAIPNFTDLPELYKLQLNDNNLSDVIPDFSSLNGLREIYLYNNNFIGEIPAAFAQSDITVLVIYNNLLSGCYDPSLLNLCDNLSSWSNQNNDISDGNAFIIPWEDFCANIEFSCDTFDLAVSFDSIAPPSCNNDDAYLSIEAYFGSPPYEFHWSDPTLDTAAHLNDLPEGTYAVTVMDCNGAMVADTVVLSMPTSPTVDTVNVQQAYCEDVGSFTATASGGASPYEYSIDTTFDTNNIFNDLPENIYMLQVVDSLNCRDTITVEIESSSLPQIQEVTPVPTCADEETGTLTVGEVIGGTPSFLYSINGGSTQISPEFTDLAPSSYTITVQDIHGCEGTYDVDVIPLALPQIETIDTIPACGIGEGEITIQASGLTDTLYYHANDTTQTEATFTGLGAGTYNIIVEDANGCTTTDQITLADLPPLQMNIIDTSATCQEPNGSFEIMSGGGTPNYQYRLEGGMWQDSPNFSGLAGGSTYNVYVMDNIGCLKLDSVTLGDTPLPKIDSVWVTDATCQIANASIEVFASEGTPDFRYLIGNDTQNVSVLEPLAGAINDTTYRVIVEDQYGCADTTQVSISDTPRVDFGVTFFAPECGEDNGIIIIDTISGTYPYLYDFGEGSTESLVADGLPGGDYFITVTDDVGCQKDTLIEFDSSIPLSVTVIVDSEPCIGDDNCGEVQINLSGWENPSVVGWNLVDSTYQSCVPVGTTSFVIMDADTCRLDTFIHFEPFEYQANVSPESAELRIGDNQNFQIINAIQADWYSEEDSGLDNLNFEDDELRLNATFTAPPYTDNNNGCEQNITYKIVAYNTAGNCKDTLLLPIRVANEIKIPPGISPNGDGFNDVFEIPIFDNYDNIKFVIFNRWGDRVYEFIQKEGQSYQGNEWDGTYHKNGISTGTKLPDGDYFYTLQFGNCLKIQRGSIFIR